MEPLREKMQEAGIGLSSIIWNQAGPDFNRIIRAYFNDKFYQTIESWEGLWACLNDDLGGSDDFTTD